MTVLIFDSKPCAILAQDVVHIVRECVWAQVLKVMLISMLGLNEEPINAFHPKPVPKFSKPVLGTGPPSITLTITIGRPV